MARLSLTNTTNVARRVVHSEDEFESSSDESDDDGYSSPTAAKSRSSRRRTINTPDTSIAFAADVDADIADDDDDDTPAQPRTPFGQARALLRAPLPADTPLVGRETERRELTAYLRATSSKSLYVSGGPGTGKTALVREVLNAFDKNQQRLVDEDGDELEDWARELPARKVYVNCVGRREEAVWDTILDALDDVDSDEDEAPRGRSPVKNSKKQPRKRPVTSSPTKARGKRDGKREFENWLGRTEGRW